ncbi:MAG: peroxiredoxin family protein [Planctomycetota bacterium]|jgi:peroxiredoxin
MRTADMLPVQIVSVTLGTEEEALKFAGKHGFPFPVTYDNRDWFDEAHSTKTFGFQMLPHTVLLDPDGNVAGTLSQKDIKAEGPVIEKVRALSQKFMKKMTDRIIKEAGPKEGER